MTIYKTGRKRFAGTGPTTYEDLNICECYFVTNFEVQFERPDTVKNQSRKHFKER